MHRIISIILLFTLGSIYYYNFDYQLINTNRSESIIINLHDNYNYKFTIDDYLPKNLPTKYYSIEFRGHAIFYYNNELCDKHTCLSHYSKLNKCNINTLSKCQIIIHNNNTNNNNFTLTSIVNGISNYYKIMFINNNLINYNDHRIPI